VILNRHFDSKTDLYQAVLDRFCGVLGAHVAEPVGGFTDASIDGMVQAAAAEQQTYLQAIEPAGFTIDTLRVNAYAFLSDQARNASAKYGVKSISLLATKSAH